MKNRVLILFFALVSVFAAKARAYSNENETATWQVEGFKPNYFLLGNPDAKLNLSFKLPLVVDWDLYFGYSQLMLWQIKEESSPFEDVNYNPELFYRLKIADKSDTWVDVGLFEHESNGRGKDESRGWNRFYLLYSSEAVRWDLAKVHWNIKGWLPYEIDKNNRDLVNYRGFYEVGVTLSSVMGTSFERSDLTLRAFSGGGSGMDLTEGAQELTLRIKSRLTSTILPVVTLQLFNGYGESLLHYDTRKSEFRIGVGF